MSLCREDLVAYAIGGLDDAGLARIEAQLDKEARTELDRIREHLAIHDAVEEIAPDPRVWQSLRERLDEPALPRSLVQRFWMPMAAAALVLVAVFAGQRPGTAGPAVKRLHGAMTRSADGTITSSRVSRIAIGNGVVVTLDTDTIIQPLTEQRLALKAGRIFLQVARSRRGFTVEAGDIAVVTTGTAFSVRRDGDTGACAVVDGNVDCRVAGKTTTVAAGHEFAAGQSAPRPVAEATVRAWFRRPTLTAQILAPDRIEIVIRNEMPDSIQKAPPTGGEPLFYATYGGRSVPLDGVLDTTLLLKPGEEKRFEVRLPAPLKDGEALFISSPALNLGKEEAVEAVEAAEAKGK